MTPEAKAASPDASLLPGPPAGSAAEGGGLARVGRAALMLALATVLAAAATAGILLFVFRADFLSEAAAAVTRWMFRHGLLAAAAAGSPIFAVLLVGYGYMQRAIRRRAAQAAAASGRPPAS